jgi:predicted deacylase
MNSAVRTGSIIIALSWVVLLGGCDGAQTLASASASAPNADSKLDANLYANPNVEDSTRLPGAPAPQIRPDLFIAPPAAIEVQRVVTNNAPTVHDTAESAMDTGSPAEQPAVDVTATGADAVANGVAAKAADAGAAEAADGYPLLGAIVGPGQREHLTWSATETFTGPATPTAVLVVNGRETGPTLCLTAAVHGDELNGIETVRRVVHDVNPEKLRGTLIAVPIVNLEAFHRHSRYLPDRRDLNRFFPGNPTGSSASRIAHSFFTEVIQHCDGLVDLHTGSFHRTNLPQLRADLSVAAVVELTKGFGATVTLHSEGGPGTLRRAAVDAGIPAVTLEAGAPLSVQDADVKHAVKSIHTLLDKMDMYDKRGIWGNPEPVYYTSRWVRADSGGVMFGQVKLGKRVRVGDLLATVTDPITNKHAEIVSPFTGRVLGMAMDQFVMPGFATFHIGIEAEVDEATQGSDELELDHAVAVYEPERDQNE